MNNPLPVMIDENDDLEDSTVIAAASLEERRRPGCGLMYKKLSSSPKCLERQSLQKLEGLIERCKTQDERNIVAAAWGRRLRYQEARTEKRLAKKQQRRLKRMGL